MKLFSDRGSIPLGSTKRNGHDFSSCPFLLAVELFRTSPILAKERSRVSYPGPRPAPHTPCLCCLKLILHVEAEVDHVATVAIAA